MVIEADTYLSEREVADQFGVCQKTINRRWKSGEFPRPIQFGRQYRWPVEVIRAWAAEQAGVAVNG